MPTLIELRQVARSQQAADTYSESSNDEIVMDSRANLTPSQFVELKFNALESLDRGQDRRDLRLKHCK